MSVSIQDGTVSPPKVPRHSVPEGSAGREEGKPSVVSPTDADEDGKHPPIQSKKLFAPPEETITTTRVKISEPSKPVETGKTGTSQGQAWAKCQ